MTQSRRDHAFKAEFGRRLSTLVARLGLSWVEVSVRLGYKNDATVRQAAKGRTLLSAERLAILGEFEDDAGARVSVDWLLTGNGAPVIKPAGQPDALSALLAGASPDALEDVKAYLRVRQRIGGREHPSQ